MVKRVGTYRPLAAVASLVLLLLVLGSGPALAQYPPPVPEPPGQPGEATLECEIEAGPDFLIVTCVGSGFAPDTEVLIQLFIGITGPADLEVEGLVLNADENGDLLFTVTVPQCDLSALKVVATGLGPGGETLEATDTIDDPASLACVSGTLSNTGFDWLRWLALGLVLMTAGAWIANVRDEHSNTFAV